VLILLKKGTDDLKNTRIFQSKWIILKKVIDNIYIYNKILMKYSYKKQRIKL